MSLLALEQTESSGRLKVTHECPETHLYRDPSHDTHCLFCLAYVSAVSACLDLLNVHFSITACMSSSLS